ncbi:MAG TPA: hypothetical protein VFN10_08185 [Thermoanaerobaculia bacterium]|nr:hypothetical protein [Thermoanaerobaculia bacterium]
MSLYFLLAIAFGVITGADAAAAARPAFAVAAVERSSRASRAALRTASARRGAPRSPRARVRITSFLRLEVLLSGITPIRAPAL